MCCQLSFFFDENPVQQALHYYTEISEFKFLGSLVTCDSDCGKDALVNITARNQFYQALKNYETKICINTHKTKNIYYINYHIVLYGCETWALTVQMKLFLETWEQNVLSKM
jgi:hypothetical protein